MRRAMQLTTVNSNNNSSGLIRYRMKKKYTLILKYVELCLLHGRKTICQRSTSPKSPMQQELHSTYTAIRCLESIALKLKKRRST